MVNVYELYYAIKWKFDMWKTKLIYKRFFGRIGDRSTICKPMIIRHPEKMFLGCHVRIREFARIEAVTEYNTQQFSPRLEIGDDTGFEQGLHLICAKSVKIGKSVTVSAYVMIQDAEHDYRDIEINVLEQKLCVSPVEIGDGTFIGLGARIMPGTKLGKHCIVGSNAVVLGGGYILTTVC